LYGRSAFEGDSTAFGGFVVVLEDTDRYSRKRRKTDEKRDAQTRKLGPRVLMATGTRQICF
jgi:hypothetical protein